MLTPAELRSFPWSDVSYLIVNEGEILDLLGAFGQSPSTSKGDVVEYIRALATSEEFGGKVRIVCTLGAQGVMYATDGSAGQVLTKNAGKLENPVKDTTGAGDCFLGYLTAGLMRGESVEEALNTCLAVSLGIPMTWRPRA
jgi:ribokinase